MMRILGIDPGTATTGYGVIEANGEAEFSLVEYGLIETSKEEKPAVRLKLIFKQLNELITKHEPEVLAIERVFFFSNQKTVIAVGQAMGVVMLSASEAGVPVVEYAPAQIKKRIAGNGRADKRAMKRAVRDYFKYKIRLKRGQKTHFDNAADALAVALCHWMGSQG
jgi:crossover junction endodeoxyribonuclease RuvC